LFGFVIEMSVYDIGSYMPPLSQKPGCCKENYPQQGIFGCLHDPYSRLCKEESHADGVTDSSRYKNQYSPGYRCHYLDELIKKLPEKFHTHCPFLESKD
jgi:hypothetical protein